VTTVGSSSFYFDGGTSAEWVDERPEVGGGYSILANYGSVSWNTCYAATESWTYYSMQSFTYQYCKLKSTASSGKFLASPSITSATTFTDTYLMGW